MRIAFIELSNFRRLKATKIDFAKNQSLFVGANNSGKTSAMVALRLFLKEHNGFTTRDITLSNWKELNKLAENWINLDADEAPDSDSLTSHLPSLDVWLEVRDTEIHHVAHILPTFDWTGGLLGVRLRLEPKDINILSVEYAEARQTAIDRLSNFRTKTKGPETNFELWPSSLQDYLDRRFNASLSLHAYLLDPNAYVEPRETGVANPQPLPAGAAKLERDPFAKLIRINEIRAQRGFSDATERSPSDDDDSVLEIGHTKRRLSEQLRAYYGKHIDPLKDPTEADVAALEAVYLAEKTFDEKLEIGFESAMKELENLGYPGLSNPKLKISTRIRPTDGLKHPSAVQYDLGSDADMDGNRATRLPEEYSGLGFQNLISIVFLLMRFRDDWMQVGKAKRVRASTEDAALPPLQLVLVEEPEAHLHAQVQQVFIGKAYDVLRNHPDLKDKLEFETQLIVSTHSSYVAHEAEFGSLRYFRRVPAASKNDVPNTVVANLSAVFGGEPETHRFVTRYLRTTHCDLFFADGSVLIEGAAERILVPHFIRNHHPSLSQRYVSLLEIGGSHAHKLRPLIELLSIPTLIITDLDAVDPKPPHKSVQPVKGASVITSNSVLKSWHPQLTSIDELQAMGDDDKCIVVNESSSVRVAFQTPIFVQLGEKTEYEEVWPSTFEDALVLSNPEVIKDATGVATTNGIAKMTKESTVASELATGLFERLRSADKAAFALDLLDLPLDSVLAPPQYIADGLSWLQTQLERVEVEFPSAPDDTGTARASRE